MGKPIVLRRISPPFLALLAWCAAPVAGGEEPTTGSLAFEQRVDWLRDHGARVALRERTPPAAQDGEAARPLVKYVLLGESWTGGDEGFDRIQWLADRQPGFFNLYITGRPEVSEQRLERFREAAPHATVLRRSAAALGIAASPVSGAPCEVRRVRPGSSAAKAGVRVGDVIVRFDGEPVPDFERLVELLHAKQPGDHAALLVRRDGEQIPLRVTLTKWRPPAADIDLQPLLAEVRKLVKKHYPKAEVTLKGETIHFEFNTRTFMIHELNRPGSRWRDAHEEPGPQPGGIHCDIHLRQGKYEGPAAGLPWNLDKRYFTIYWSEPYSEKLDRRLSIRLKYPQNVSPQFLRDFKKLTDDFASHLPAPEK